MAVRIKIKEHDRNDVHFDAMTNNYTLCGLETGGDLSLGIHEGITTNKKVNCAHCIRVVKLCQSINTNEFI